MNKVVISGRLTRNPETRYSQDGTCVSKYTLAVDRKTKGEADFINVTAFGKAGEFTEKYLTKGMKMIVSGRIQTGSYTNKDGAKVYTTEVVAEDQEFAESKKDSSATPANNDEWQNIPEGITEDLPFNKP